MSNKPQKIAPAWHAQVAAELNKEFSSTAEIVLNARKRAAYLGLKFIWVKEMGKADGSIPHGQFENWLENNCPQIPRTTIGDYITEANSLCERMGWQKSDFRIFEIPPHKLIELPPDKIPAKEQKAQQLLLDLVEARGKFRAVTEYKQVDADGKPQRGQKKGSKGCTKEMRLKAKYASEKEELEALETFTAYMTTVLNEKSTLNGFPRLDEVHGGKKTLEQFAEAVKDTHLFLQSLKRK